MSDTVIRDGAGTGYRVKVSPDNRLQSTSLQISAPGYIIHTTGKYWAVACKEFPVAATTEVHALWVQNTDSSHHFHIDEMCLTYNGGNTNHNRVAWMRVYADSSTPSAGYTEFSPSGLDIGKTIVLPITARKWDKVTGMGMTVASATTQIDGISGFCVNQGRVANDIKLGAIVEPGHSILLSVYAEEAGTATVTLKGLFYGSILG